MKPYNEKLSKTTAFFTDYTPERILKELTDVLTSCNTQHDISSKTWKVSYVKLRDEAP